MIRKQDGWNKGYTSTELLLAIVLLGVLLLFAIPRYIEKSKEGERVLRDLGAVSVRAGLARFETAPKKLDALPSGTNCSAKNPCFLEVLPEGVVSEEWRKVDDTHYTFRRGSDVDHFEYDPISKTFSAK